MLNYIFSNGIELDNNRIQSQSIKKDATPGALAFGTVASSYLELVLDNTDNFFDSYSFKNVDITILDEDERKMRVYIDETKEKNRLLTIKAYDKISSLDAPWITCKTPIILYDFIEDICNQVGIKTSIPFTLPNGGFKIQKVDKLNGKTCRECLGYALEICGCFAYLNADEILELRWFDFENTSEININRLINYNSDYENVNVDNIYFVRSSTVYKTNENTPNGSIFLTKDNPLLEDCSSAKISSILSNLTSKVNFEYLPCDIQVANPFTYDIGNVLTFTDLKGNERMALVGSINYSAYNSVKISSPNIDEQTISTNSTSNSTNNSNSYSGGISFKHISNQNDIEISECNENTRVFVSCTFDLDVAGEVLFYLDTELIKTHKGHIGTNTISFTLEEFLDSKKIVKLNANNLTVNNVDYSFIYMNCMIIDYSEEDDEVGTGEVEYTIPSTMRFERLGYNRFYYGIQGWRYKEESFTYNKEPGILSMLYHSDLSSVLASETDHLPELYDEKKRVLYDNMVNDKHYIKVFHNGTFTDNAGNVYTFENIPCLGGLGGFAYQKKKKGETTYKTYIAKKGIIEIDNETEIYFGMICDNNIRKLEDIEAGVTRNFEFLDNDLNVVNMGTGTTYIARFLDTDGKSYIRSLKPTSNGGTHSQYIPGRFIGDYKDSISHGVHLENNKDIDTALRYNQVYFLYRNYANSGWEEWTKTE